jgi:hypothetical protein
MPAEIQTPPAVEPTATEVRAPAQLRLAVRWANYLFFMPLVGLTVVLFGTLALLCGLWDQGGRQQHAVARMWGRVMLWSRWNMRSGCWAVKRRCMRPII